MRSKDRLIVGAGVAAGLVFLTSFSVHAAPAGVSGNPQELPGHASISGNGNCTVDAASLSKSGTFIDEMTGGPNGGPVDTFGLDSGGTVVWDAGSGVPITNHSYSVQIFGVTVMSGGSPNKDKTTTASGSLDLGKVFPFEIVGEIPATGTISGDGVSCTGQALIHLIGQPAGTVPWDAGAASLLVGILGMGLSTPSRKS